MKRWDYKDRIRKTEIRMGGLERGGGGKASWMSDVKKKVFDLEFLPKNFNRMLEISRTKFSFSFVEFNIRLKFRK